MNTREEQVWKSLLAQSSPTFAGDLTPPLGLAARVLAQVREAQVRESASEYLGLRAIFASLAAVAVLGVVTLAYPHRDDVDGPVRSLAALEDMPLS